MAKQGKAAPSVVERLHELQATAAERSRAARGADAAAQLALARVEEARRARVEAHAAGDSTAVRGALTSYQAAEQKAEDTALAAEGARLAAARAQAEADEFKADHADELIAALKPEADAATAELSHHAHALVDAAAKWRAVADQVDGYLPHTRGPHQPPTGRRPRTGSSPPCAPSGT
jgi:hypothetical protein